MADLFQSVVLTGGGGMLAHAVADALRARGTPPTVLTRADCDITRAQDVQRLFREHRPTLLINCAAHTKVDLCEDEPDRADASNGHAVGLLASGAKERGAALVHYSTDFVFDGKGSRPYRSDDPVGPICAYGRSKLLGERLLQQNGPQRWLIVRTAWLYGLHGPSFPRTIIERARGGHPLRVVDDQVGSPTFTEDLAGATFELLERGAAGVWHVTNEGATSWFDFAKAALQAFDVKAELSQISTADWLKLRPKQAARPAYSVLDVEPYRRLAGHPMRPWHDALRAFRDQVQQAGGF